MADKNIDFSIYPGGDDKAVLIEQDKLGLSQSETNDDLLRQIAYLKKELNVTQVSKENLSNQVNSLK